MKRSVAKESFNFMNDIAIKYENARVSYILEQQINKQLIKTHHYEKTTTYITLLAYDWVCAK